MAPAAAAASSTRPIAPRRTARTRPRTRSRRAPRLSAYLGRFHEDAPRRACCSRSPCPAGAAALGPGAVDASFGTNGSVFTRLGPLVEPGTSVAGARDVAERPRRRTAGGRLGTRTPTVEPRAGRRALPVGRQVGRQFRRATESLSTNSASAASRPRQRRPFSPGRTGRGCRRQRNDEQRSHVCSSSRATRAAGRRLWAATPMLDAAERRRRARRSLSDATGRLLVAGRSGSEPVRRAPRRRDGHAWTRAFAGRRLPGRPGRPRRGRLGLHARRRAGDGGARGRRRRR